MGHGLPSPGPGGVQTRPRRALRRSTGAIPVLTAVLLVGVVGALEPGQRAAAGDLRPTILHWPGRSNPVGLLYVPHVLQGLAARSGVRAGSRVAEAIQARTPIVVMWSIRSWRDRGDDSELRPYHIVITRHAERLLDVQPLWIEQDLPELRQLDRHTRFLMVGAVAAFPADAFEPGRVLLLHSRRERTETGMLRRHQVFAGLTRVRAQDPATAR